MKEAKILLTINLEGVLSNKTEVSVLPFVKHNEKGTVIVKKGSFVHKERIAKKCEKKVRLSEATYNYFIDPVDAPSWYKPKYNKGKLWGELSDLERINLHCEKIAEGKEFRFEIIDN